MGRILESKQPVSDLEFFQAYKKMNSLEGMKVTDNTSLAAKVNRPEGGVTIFGGNKEIDLREKVEMQTEGDKKKPKKIEGGYFSIEHGKYTMSNKNGQEVDLPLVKKTLKEKRRQEGEKEINLLKMQK